VPLMENSKASRGALGDLAAAPLWWIGYSQEIHIWTNGTRTLSISRGEANRTQYKYNRREGGSEVSCQTVR